MTGKKYFKGKTDREIERQGDIETGRHGDRGRETQRHRDTVSEKYFSMSLKILDSLENLGSHLDQTNQE